jgi:hypothetical protein
MLVGYMRVSTDGDRQVLDLQRDALLTAGVDGHHLFEDRVSGSRGERAGLARALATLQLSGVTSPNGVGQDALHGGEVGNLRSHVGQVSRRDLAHLSADTVAMHSRQPEQGAHFIQCEAQLTRPAHEYQAPNLLRTIASIAPVPARVRQDPNTLVVADGFDIAAGAARQRADRDFVLGQTSLRKSLSL